MTRAALRFLLIGVLAGSGALSARSARAQGAASTPRGPTAVNVRAAAASHSQLRVAESAKGPRLLPKAAESNNHRARMYMIVGGAALLGGSFVPGSAGPVIMVGGGGVFIYGLYRFLD